jgi:hypothetical protein
MAKHHPDLVFCRKQPGIGDISSLNPSHFSFTSTLIHSLNFFLFFLLLPSPSHPHPQPLEDYARSVTESVLFAIPMSVHMSW